LRFGRPKVPKFIRSDAPFEIGKAQHLMQGSHVTLVATGHLVWEALLAAMALRERGIEADVLNMHTIKPLDLGSLIQSAQKTGCVVTAEEHQRIGGLGSMVAHALAAHQPVPQESVAMNDRFGESGTPEQLMAKYGLNAAAILDAAERVLMRKRVSS